jgi:hypothetical protein
MRCGAWRITASTTGHALRLWGSAAFVVGALACGLSIDVISPAHLIRIIVAVAGISALASFGLQPLEECRKTGAGSAWRLPPCCAIPAFSPLSWHRP